jgi:hypothetical protein
VTGDLIQQSEQGGTTYYQPQYEPTAPAVRGMPAPTRGTRGALQAGNMLDLGALAAASGMTRAQITGLLDDLQESNLATTLAALPKILERNRQITQARINEMATRVNRLRRVQWALPQTGIRGFLGMAPDPALQVNAPEYVSLAEVLAIFNETIAGLVTSD